MFRNPENYSIYTMQNEIHTYDINRQNYEIHYYQPLINMMRDHIDDPNVMDRKYKIIFEDDEYVIVNVIDLFINLTLWNIPILANMRLTSEYFVFDHVINNDIIAKYIDNIIDKLIDKVDRKFINNIIADTIIKFNLINEFAFFISNSISLFDIINLMDRSSNVKEILENDLSNSNFVNIKEDSDKLAKSFFKNIKEDGNSCLYDYVASDNGFSLKQFRECLTSIGVKPDGLGGIFQIPIFNSYMNGGCNNPLYYRIDASTARTSQIIIESNVGKSGDFSNRLSYNNLDTLLHPDPTYVCDTKNYLKVTIENEKDLKLYSNRYYRYPNTDLEHCISDKDYHLIGKTIEMRSPMKCNSYTQGRGVCYRCYGKLANINRGLNIGKIASDLLSSSCTQPQLSSKHILEVKMYVYNWSDIFNEYFTEDEYIIRVNETTDLNARLVIYKEDIECIEQDGDMDDDDEDSELFTVSSVYLELEDNGELINIIPPNINHLIVMSPLLEIIDDYTIINEELDEEIIVIPLSNIEKEIVFSVPILNDDLINIIENCKKYISRKKNIEEVFANGGTIDTLAELFRKSVINDAKLNVNPLHLEVIMASQIYKDRTCMERPDWSFSNPEHTMVDLGYSLKNNPSVIVSLINGYLSHILSKPNTFKKENKSVFDPLYSPSLVNYYNKTL